MIFIEKEIKEKDDKKGGRRSLFRLKVMIVSFLVLKYGWGKGGR